MGEGRGRRPLLCIRGGWESWSVKSAWLGELATQQEQIKSFMHPATALDSKESVKRSNLHA